jgi:hypothetical protein
MHSHDEDASPIPAPRVTFHWHTPKSVLVGRLGRELSPATCSFPA